MVKTIVNRRQQLGCHHSELYLGRSKKSNNQGIKVKVKRTLIYYFLSRKKRRQALLEIFLNPEYWCAGVSNPPSQNQCPVTLSSLLFQVPGQDQQNGKHCHLLPQSFRITLNDTSSIYQGNNIFMDHIRLSSIHDFKVSHNHVYPTMVVKNIQIHDVVISGIWIYKSKN